MSDVLQQSENRGPVSRGPINSAANGQFALAPMTIADLLDVTFELIKASWRSITILSLMLAIPLALSTFILNLAFGGNAGEVTGSPADGLTNIGTRTAAAAVSVTLMSLFISVVPTPLIAGAITRIVAGSYLGREFDAISALKSMIPFWLTLIGAVLIAHLALIPGTMAFGIGYFAVSTIFWIVVPVIAVEEVGAAEALRRSWRLIAPRFFQYVGVWLVAAVVAWFVGTIVSVLPTIAALVATHNTFLASLFQGMRIILSTIVVTPLAAVIATLVYFDARVRVEGFDVQMMAADLPEPTDPQGPVVP